MRLISFVILLFLAATAIAISLPQYMSLDRNALPYITLAGLTVGLLTFLWNAAESRTQSRKQHTITILFQTRLSPEFRGNLEKRKAFFPEDQPISALDFFTYLKVGRTNLKPEDTEYRQRKCAEAVRSLLNYYEFLSFGIRRNDLDEEMLRQTIRLMMCALVRDCHEIITSAQTNNPRVYTNLSWLYERWRDPDWPALSVAAPPHHITRVRERLAEWIAPR